MRQTGNKFWGALMLIVLSVMLAVSGCSISVPNDNNGDNAGTNSNPTNDPAGNATEDEIIERFGIKLDNLDLDGTLHGQYEGQQLIVPVMSGDFEAAINAVVPIFERLSGADVIVETAPGAQLTDKIQLDISSTHRYDVILAPIANLHSYAASGNLESLQPYVDDYASESYDLDDFLPGYFNAIGKYQEELVAIPYKPDVQLLFYRKDLFEDEAIKSQYEAEYGEALQVPETNEQMIQIAEFFTKKVNPDSAVDYGYVNTMLKGSSRWLWINRGAEVIDANGEPGFNNEAGLKAMEDMLALQKYAPNEWLQMGWDEGNQFFANGNAAMMEQWPGLWTTVQADTSAVKDKVGMAVTPGQTPVLGGWGISIASASEDKELAWKFIEFLTSRDGELLKIEHTMDPSRASVYEIEGVSDYNPNYDVFMEALKHAKTLADIDVPYATAQLNDVTELYVQQTLTGALAPQEALDQMEEAYIRTIEDVRR